jgi:hypothetical protein
MVPVLLIIQIQRSCGSCPFDYLKCVDVTAATNATNDDPLTAAVCVMLFCALPGAAENSNTNTTSLLRFPLRLEYTFSTRGGQHQLFPGLSKNVPPCGVQKGDGKTKQPHAPFSLLLLFTLVHKP